MKQVLLSYLTYEESGARRGEEVLLEHSAETWVNENPGSLTCSSVPPSAPGAHCKVALYLLLLGTLFSFPVSRQAVLDELTEQPAEHRPQTAHLPESQPVSASHSPAKTPTPQILQRKAEKDLNHVKFSKPSAFREVMSSRLQATPVSLWGPRQSP